VALLALATAATAATVMDQDVDNAIALFKKSDPKIQDLFKTAYGYAVLPKIGKGAAGIGVAAGEGQVFEKGKLVGTAKMSQVTLGPQLGGQSYAEVIFFETPQVMEEFKNGKFAMSAGLSAVAAADGAALTAKYQQGTMVFSIANNGLMFEASVGGQKFHFEPVSER
jgi:lipid-binding SYLF domain-containing protein